MLKQTTKKEPTGRLWRGQSWVSNRQFPYAQPVQMANSRETQCFTKSPLVGIICFWSSCPIWGYADICLNLLRTSVHLTASTERLGKLWKAKRWLDLSVLIWCSERDIAPLCSSVLNHLVPSWGHCLWKFGNFQEVQLCWRKYVTGGRLWGSVASPYFLFFLIASCVQLKCDLSASNCQNGLKCLPPMTV